MKITISVCKTMTVVDTINNWQLRVFHSYCSYHCCACVHNTHLQQLNRMVVFWHLFYRGNRQVLQLWHFGPGQGGERCFKYTTCILFLKNPFFPFYISLIFVFILLPSITEFHLSKFLIWKSQTTCRNKGEKMFKKVILAKHVVKEWS